MLTEALDCALVSSGLFSVMNILWKSLCVWDPLYTHMESKALAHAYTKPIMYMYILCVYIHILYELYTSRYI